MFAYAVMIGNVRYCVNKEAAILVTLLEELTIIIPSSTTRPVRYIDVPLSKIEDISIAEKGCEVGTDSISGDVETALIIRLSFLEGSTFYLNAGKQSDDLIHLAFETVNDATFVKSCILREKVATNRKGVHVVGSLTVDVSQNLLGSVNESATPEIEDYAPSPPNDISIPTNIPFSKQDTGESHQASTGMPLQHTEHVNGKSKIMADTEELKWSQSLSLNVSQNLSEDDDKLVQAGSQTIAPEGVIFDDLPPVSFGLKKSSDLATQQGAIPTSNESTHALRVAHPNQSRVNGASTSYLPASADKNMTVKTGFADDVSEDELTQHTQENATMEIGHVSELQAQIKKHPRLQTAPTQSSDKPVLTEPADGFDDLYDASPKSGISRLKHIIPEILPEVSNRFQKNQDHDKARPKIGITEPKNHPVQKLSRRMRGGSLEASTAPLGKTPRANELSEAKQSTVSPAMPISKKKNPAPSKSKARAISRKRPPIRSRIKTPKIVATSDVEDDVEDDNEKNVRKVHTYGPLRVPTSNLANTSRTMNGTQSSRNKSAPQALIPAPQFNTLPTISGFDPSRKPDTGNKASDMVEIDWDEALLENGDYPRPTLRSRRGKSPKNKVVPKNGKKKGLKKPLSSHKNQAISSKSNATKGKSMSNKRQPAPSNLREPRTKRAAALAADKKIRGLNNSDIDEDVEQTPIQSPKQKVCNGIIREESASRPHTSSTERNDSRQDDDARSAVATNLGAGEVPMTAYNIVDSAIFDQAEDQFPTAHDNDQKQSATPELEPVGVVDGGLQDGDVECRSSRAIKLPTADAGAGFVEEKLGQMGTDGMGGTEEQHFQDAFESMHPSQANGLEDLVQEKTIPPPPPCGEISHVQPFMEQQTLHRLNSSSQIAVQAPENPKLEDSLRAEEKEGGGNRHHLPTTLLHSKDGSIVVDEDFLHRLINPVQKRLHQSSKVEAMTSDIRDLVMPQLVSEAQSLDKATVADAVNPTEIESSEGFFNHVEISDGQVPADLQVNLVTDKGGCVQTPQHIAAESQIQEIMEIPNKTSTPKKKPSLERKLKGALSSVPDLGLQRVVPKATREYELALQSPGHSERPEIRQSMRVVRPMHSPASNLRRAELKPLNQVNEDSGLEDGTVNNQPATTLHDGAEDQMQGLTFSKKDSSEDPEHNPATNTEHNQERKVEVADLQSSSDGASEDRSDGSEVFSMASIDAESHAVRKVEIQKANNRPVVRKHKTKENGMSLTDGKVPVALMVEIPQQSVEGRTKEHNKNICGNIEQQTERSVERNSAFVTEIFQDLKRKSEDLDRGASKKAKKQPAGMSRADLLINKASRNAEGKLRTPDINRKPALVSFSAKGPRNQGISSLERAKPAETLSRGFPSRTKLNPQVFQMRRGTEVANNNQQIGGPSMKEGHKITICVPRTAEHKGEELRGGSKFTVNVKSRIPSSQASRVDENGSPRLVIHTGMVNAEQGRPRASEFTIQPDIDEFLEDDDTCAVLDDEEDLPTYDEPSLQDRRYPSAKDEGIILSSNRKSSLNSPQRASSVVEQLVPHRVQPSNTFINLQTKDVVTSQNPQDPFLTAIPEAPSTFLRLIRNTNASAPQPSARKTETKQSPGQEVMRTRASKQDPDKTLVEADRSPEMDPSDLSSKQRSSSHSSRIAQQSESTDQSNAEAGSGTAKQWPGGLQPHQQGTLEALYDISHVSLLFLWAQSDN